MTRRVGADQFELTPSQSEMMRDGWHTIVVLGIADFDVLHYALTGGDADASTKAVWESIKQQLADERLLSRIARLVDSP